MSLSRVLISAAVAAAVSFPGAGSAQVRASEPGSVSQTIDGTRITIEYFRPRARGRDTLFGKEVKWEEVWTPGANWATTLEVGRDLSVNGHPLSKGKYSVWMVVHPGDWTVILDPEHHRFHTDRPDSSAAQLRFEVTPEAAPFTEVLTWSFPEVRVNGGTVAMQWGTIRIPLHLLVEPSYQLATPVDRARQYLGEYSFRWTQAPDTAKPIRFTVSSRGDSLIGRWDPAPFPEWDQFVLIPIAEDWFIPGFLMNGELYDVEREMVFEFTRASGRAAGFEVRGETDEVYATGKRMR